MNHLTAYASHHRHGARLLEDIHSASLDHLLDLGFPAAEATRLKNLAAFYFGPSRTRRLQREAIELATTRQHSLDTLAMLRTVARKCLDDRPIFELIRTFCSFPGSHDEIHTQALQHVEHINLGISNRPQKTHGRRRAVASKRPTADGLKTLQITGPADDIDRITNAVKSGIRTRMSSNRKLLRSQATYDELIHLFHNGGDIPAKTYQPVIAVGLPAACQLLDGHGDDILLACSDGRIMTGADYLTASLTDELHLALIHPVEGPANLYRTRRLANRKQRTLAKAENPICPAPGCRTPADDCDIHHLDSWAREGDTNISRLAAVCRTDNARNDDDPDSPRNGRFDRIDGKIHWVPVGGTPQRNTHPAAQMGLMDLI